MKPRPRGWPTSVARCGLRAFAVSGSIGYRSAPTAHWAVQRPLFVGQYGRLRTVVAAPDGTLWFTTSNRDGRGSARDGDDRILQFRP